MAKSFNRICLVVILLGFCGLGRSFGHHVTDSTQLAEQSRNQLCIIIENEVGVTEIGGNNRGPRVEEYLRAVGLGGGYAWCAAFVRWSFDQAGIITTITAWSPSAVPVSKMIYQRGKTSSKPIQGGDVFSLYYANLKRVGHTGFVLKVEKDHYVTIEGNTTLAGTRESNTGDGVLKRYRPKYSIYSIANWIDK